VSTVSVEFKMTPEQRASLRAQARERDISVQELLELTFFGQLRPRERKRRKSLYQREELPIAG
jgi:hypothetical protein